MLYVKDSIRPSILNFLAKLSIAFCLVLYYHGLSRGSVISGLSVIDGLNMLHNRRSPTNTDFGSPSITESCPPNLPMAGF